MPKNLFYLKAKVKGHENFIFEKRQNIEEDFKTALNVL